MTTNTLKHKRILVNLLTCGRLFGVILIIIFSNIWAKDNNNWVWNSYYQINIGQLICWCTAFLAGCTDLIDGKLARKYQITSRFGHSLDAVNDLLLMSAWAFFTSFWGLVRWWTLGVFFLERFLIFLIVSFCCLSFKYEYATGKYRGLRAISLWLATIYFWVNYQRFPNCSEITQESLRTMVYLSIIFQVSASIWFVYDQWPYLKQKLWPESPSPKLVNT